ncbi:hypothetical protein AAC387_Pa03g4587 [Persea americana]
MWPSWSSSSLPTKAEWSPSQVTAMATMVGVPPGALRKARASARETPEKVGDEVDKHFSKAHDQTMRGVTIPLEKSPE